MTEVTLLSEVSGTYILAGAQGVGKTSMALKTASKVAGDVTWFDFQNGPDGLSRLAGRNSVPMPARYHFSPSRAEMLTLLAELQPSGLAVVDCWQTASSSEGMDPSFGGVQTLWLAPLHESVIRSGGRLLTVDSGPNHARGMKDAFSVATRLLHPDGSVSLLKSRFELAPTFAPTPGLEAGVVI